MEDIIQKKIDITEPVIKQLHYLILKSIDNENAGKYRNVNVLISGSKHRPPAQVIIPEKMQDLMEWYESNKGTIHPVTLAAEFHHKFTFIHPFIDGNGRCARLFMNFILLQHGYPLTVINIDEREVYMAALEKASTENDMSDFLQLVKRSIERSMDMYLFLLGD